jgi:hypothetical protein
LERCIDIIAAVQDTPAVGKDSPPDLAHLVPSGILNSSGQPVENATPTNVPHQNKTGQLSMHDILVYSHNYTN